MCVINIYADPRKSCMEIYSFSLWYFVNFMYFIVFPCWKVVFRDFPFEIAFSVSKGHFRVFRPFSVITENQCPYVRLVETGIEPMPSPFHRSRPGPKFMELLRPQNVRTYKTSKPTQIPLLILVTKGRVQRIEPNSTIWSVIHLSHTFPVGQNTLGALPMSQSGPNSVKLLNLKNLLSTECHES